MDCARAQNDVVVVSVFVNPTQFNNAADLATYPRTEAADEALLDASGVDYMFLNFPFLAAGREPPLPLF